MELELQQIYKFTEQGNNFLVASTDNKVKVFDLYSKQSQSFVLQNQNLNSLVTCADIKQNQKENEGKCVFGNNKGQVLFCSLNQTDKINVFNFHSKPIIDLTFSENSDYIYTISRDKQLKKIDIKLQQEIFALDVKKRGFVDKAKLISFGQNQIVYSVDNKIVLLNTETNQEVVKYTGHSQNIQILKKCKENSYFISFSNEGYINIYNGQQSNPVYTVNILSQSKIVNLEIFTVKKNVLVVLIHQTNQITLSQIVLNNKNQGKPQETTHIINLLKPILFSAVQNNQTLQVVYGSTVDTKFKSIKIFDKEVQNKKQQQIPQIDKAGIQQQLNQILQDSVQIQKTTNPNNTQKEQNSSTYVVGDVDYNEEIQKDVQEIDIEEQKEIVNAFEKKKQDDMEQDEENQISTAKSLAVVMLQGLHNNDQQLIDFCLEKDDDSLIENTIKKLLPSKVFILVENIIDRFHRFPYKASILCKWLGYIIKYHNSILISTPQLSQKIGPLLQMIEGRTKNLNKLIALRGKIDMVLSLRRAQKAKQQEETEEIKPLVVYNENNDQLVEDIETHMEDEDKEIDDSVSDSGDVEEEDEQDSEDDVDKDFELYQKASRQQAQDDLYGDEQEDDMQDQDSNYMEF